MLKHLVSLSIVGATLLANLQLSQAQQSDRFLSVGRDSAGYPAYIDLQSVHGNDFDLYLGYGHGLMKMGIRTNCTYKQAFQTRFTAYDENNNVVDDKVGLESEPLQMAKGSVLANAFKYMCTSR